MAALGGEPLGPPVGKPGRSPLPALARSRSVPWQAPAKPGTEGGRAPQRLASPKTSPWRRGDLQGLRWEHGVKQELGILGATGHGLFQRARNTTARELLMQAQSSGRLGALRAALRESRSQLGVDDPVVKRTRWLTTEAEQCARECRELCRAAEDLLALPQAMERLAAALARAERLERALGPGLWSDPPLAWAREAATAWAAHGPALRELARRAHEGAEAFCAEWVELVLGSSGVVEAGFGAALARQLPELPGAGAALAAALARRWGPAGGGARCWDGLGEPPPAPTDGHAARALEMARLRGMLGELDPRTVDALVLVEVPGARSGLATAAEQPAAGTAAFAALLVSLGGQGLALSQELQARLEREGRARFAPAGEPSRRGRAPASEESPQRLESVPEEADAEEAAQPAAAAAPSSTAQRVAAVAARAAELLRVEPRHLCLRVALPAGSLSLRLFPVAGQPSAAEAARLLGPGAEPEAEDARGEICARELRRWRAAGDVATDFFSLHGRCSATLAATRAGEGRAQACEAALREAEAVLAAEQARADEAGAAWNADKSEYEESRRLAKELEKEVDHWLYSGAEDADERVEATEKRLEETVAKRDAAKEREATTGPVAAKAFERRDAAEAEARRRVAALEAARAATASSGAEFARLAAECEALLHMPLVPNA